uniref:Uncharacterized protein n=1 Tax=Arundo donax TaxID=35708 RepID=A0A0A9BSH8_ARUDO
MLSWARRNFRRICVLMSFYPFWSRTS